MQKSIISFLFLLLSTPLFSQQVTQDSIQHEGVWRTYRTFTPSGYSASNAYPLVINMHGYGSNSLDQMNYSAMNSVADTAKFIVVYPQGINNSWNAGFMNPYHSGVDDVGFLSKLIDTLKRDYSLNSCKTYATGMSNGGFMSHRLACELHNKITAIAGVTGMITDSTIYYCQNQRAVPMLQIQGTSDGVVSYSGAAGYPSAPTCVEFWAQKNGCNMTADTTQFPDVNTSDNSTVTKIRYKSCTDSSEAILFRVNNGGHTWPGAVPVPSLGNTNQDIKASAEIWNFFKKYDCSNTSVSVREASAKTENALKVYPNPSEGKLVLENQMPLREIKIYDHTGKLVFSESEIRNKRKHLNVAHLPAGLYLIKTSTLDEAISVNKLILR